MIGKLTPLLECYYFYSQWNRVYLLNITPTQPMKVPGIGLLKKENKLKERGRGREEYLIKSHQTITNIRMYKK